MTLDELIPWLFDRTTNGIRWGLERTEELLAGVDDPHRLFSSVLIGGTNGKGSVAAFCDSALRTEGGARIGLYTSPHLVDFSERIRIDGVPIADGELAEVAGMLRPAIERSGASFFEATTAMAFLAFARAGVELAVVEVGLGGRLDATNVLQPLVTGVTNISREHEEYLGSDLSQIAREKAGIFRRGVPALIGEPDPQIREVLSSRALAIGADPVILDDVSRATDLVTDASGTSLRLESTAWGDRELSVPLPGLHQARNARMAAELLAMLPHGSRPGWGALESGFARTRWPGRLQTVRVRGTTYLLDVAHNPAGAVALSEALEKFDLPRPCILVAAILADKDWRRMLAPLLARCDAAILTEAPSAPETRRWDPDEAARWSLEETGVAPRVVTELGAALRRAGTLAPHGTIVITGSVHTVGDAMKALGIPSVPEP
ncbi:MAG: folylpolyglutamate synthase/dihydrofolate synthase family protein [Gemmatimonadota bacterium]